jgi:hypothetical protein
MLSTSPGVAQVTVLRFANQFCAKANAGSSVTFESVVDRRKTAVVAAVADFVVARCCGEGNNEEVTAGYLDVDATVGNNSLVCCRMKSAALDGWHRSLLTS